MTQEQDNSEQSKPTRKRAATRKTTRAADPQDGGEMAATSTPAAETPPDGTSGADNTALSAGPEDVAPPKPRRRTVKKAAETAGDEASAPDVPAAVPADGAAPAPRARRPRVSRKKTDETAEAAAPAKAAPDVAASPAESAAVSEATPAETDEAAPKKPRRRTVKKVVDAALSTGEGGDAAPAGESVVMEAAAAPAEPESSGTRPARVRRARAKPDPAPEAEEPRVDEADRTTEAAAPEIVAPLPVETATSSEVSAEIPAAEAEPAPTRPLYEDDGVVTHILPLPAEQEDRSRRRKPHRRSRPANGSLDPDGLDTAPDVSLYDIVQPPLPGDPEVLDAFSATRSKRHRSRRKRKPGPGVQPFAPDSFTDVYPASVLGVGEHFVFSDETDEFEDDGPQPALPGQPSLALPPAPLEDEDLEALDEVVNGNRIGASETGRGRGRKGRGADAARPAGKPRPAPAAGGAAPDRDETPEVPAGKRVLYMSVVPDEQVEVVITDNGQVTEYFVEMAHQAKIRGNIYKGVINNVDTNLQAAFVNFGGGKNGFLQIDEVHPEYWLTPHDSSKGPKYPPIQKVLKVGQEVLVQVVKEPAGSKGAFLTTWVSLAGRFLVLTPGQEQIGVSRKVEDPEERTRLKELLAGIEPGEDMGVIIRTASEGASKTSIQKDLQFLKRLWKDIRKRATTEKSPCLIYQEADLASRAVRDYLAEDIREIWVDNEATLESIRETTGLLFPRRQDLVKLHQDPRQTLWERFNLQRQLEEVTSREVILPSGGRLVFDQTEALMAIDINSGKTQGKSNFEAMVFRTNMEAAEAIARHLRLRDIGGQVVIDFIEMRDRNHCRDVEKTLRNAMRQDRARHDVGHMSSFGLLELVRQRTGTSAISISSEPCPYCRGTGVRRNMEWQALHALRDLQARLVKSRPSDNGKNRKGDHAAKNGHAAGASTFVYETEPELGLYLLNKKRDRLLDLENRFGVSIEIGLKACAV